MNSGPEEYDTDFFGSEAWLVEKIFSQLKDFNEQVSNPTANETPSDDISIYLKNFETQPKSEANNGDCGQNEGNIDATNLTDNNAFFTIFEGHSSTQPFPWSQDQIINQNPKCVSQQCDFNSQISQNYNEIPLEKESPVNVVELVKDPPESQISSANDTIVIYDSSKDSEYDIKCRNCESIFTPDEFSKHICDFDDNNNFVSATNFRSFPLPGRDAAEELPCVRQLRENNARIRKFIREEFKIDLGGGSGNKQDGPHECTMCERKFVHASGLSRHMEKHALDLIPNNSSVQPKSGLKVVIKCLLCGRILFTPANAMNHLSEAHKKLNKPEPEILKLEDEEENDGKEIPIENLDEIIKQVAIKMEAFEADRVDPSGIFKVAILSCMLQCEFCDYCYTEVSDLLIHESLHDPVKGFQCTRCDISVFTSKDIFFHWQTECPFIREEARLIVGLQKLFVCNVCENKFNSHEQLCDHRYSVYHLFPRKNKESDDLQLGCEYCGSIHTTAKSIISHYEENHIKKSKKETSPKYRQYLCDVCGKSYTQSSHLWQHLRFHKGVKPFACKETGCNRRFTIRPDLNDHIRKCHTGERPYHCLVCGKRFLTGSVFYQHRLIHRGERRYGCDECGKRFYRADALKNHQRIHTGEKPYDCMYCTKKFRQRGDRDKHIRARHGFQEANVRATFALQRDKENPFQNNVPFAPNLGFPTNIFPPIFKQWP